MTIDRNDPRIVAAVEAYNEGDLKKEASLLEPFLETHPDDADLLQRLGAVAAQLGEVDKAKLYLTRSLEIYPANAQVLSMLGWLHQKSGDAAEAKRLLEKTVDLNPTAPAPHIDLGNLHLAARDTLAARACYEKAIALDPNSVSALVNLASLCEREHKFEEAQALAERAVALAPVHGQANITLARIELRLGHPQKAADRLHELLTRTRLEDFDIASCFYLIGQAVEKRGDYDHAFVAFDTANDTFHQMYAARIASMDSVLAPKYLSRIHAFFEAEDVSAWTTPDKKEEPTPVFFVGFPRSGTTLLDQILSTHSAIETLEENENLIDVRNELVRPEGGLQKLATMTDDGVNHYRKKYWARVRKGFTGDVTGGLFIDKMPLNTILLGLIYRLFPEAKIIFAVRDPRDVVLSCFQQRFGMNVAMYQLLKLDTAAAYYDQVMKIGDVCRERLPLDIHMVRYEDVVGDMQRTVSDILSFLGLEWEDQMLNYRQEARERWITTPSAEQVIEPLYTSSIGKWRNYKHRLAPVLPVLEPWVKKLGYDPA